MTDPEILDGLERIFSTKNDLSTKGLCYALWQGFKPTDVQNKRIIELLAANSGLAADRLKSVFYSYWWPKGEREPRLQTIKRAKAIFISIKHG